jgi:hypothetical protein
MAWAMVAVTAVSAGVQIFQSNKNRKAAEELANEAKEAQEKEQAKLDKEKAAYKAMKFENPYENMENVYEDLTVNQQQAQFQAEQGAQQRANIMQGLRGAAGGSGIAALAQSMANQGQLATQRISASIGQQEAANRRMAARGASQIQQLERSGEQMKQQFEIDKQSTLLGMQMGATTGANQAARLATYQEQQADAAYRESIASGIGDVAGAFAGGVSARQADPNQQTYDLSQATVSGSGVDNTNALYQSSVDFQGGTGAMTIDQFGNPQFKDLSGMSIYDEYDQFGNKINK